MRLRRNERCPIHKSFFCCGREQAKAKRSAWVPVQRIEDPHHPRGYREIRSPAEMKKLLKRKIVEQRNRCGICGEPFTDFKDVVPDHKEPKGMGSARRDDHPSSASKMQPGKRIEEDFLTFLSDGHFLICRFR